MFTNTTNLLGSNNNPASNLFGSGNSTASNIFGSTNVSASSIFGSTNTSASSIFGSTNTSASNIFGSSNAPATNIFGSTNSTASNIFGLTNSTAPNIFGSTNSTAPKLTNASTMGLFGSASTLVNANTTQTAQAQGNNNQNPLFNSSSLTSGSLFNTNYTAPQASTSGTGIFGNNASSTINNLSMGTRDTNPSNTTGLATSTDSLNNSNLTSQGGKTSFSLFQSPSTSTGTQQSIFGANSSQDNFFSAPNTTSVMGVSNPLFTQTTPNQLSSTQSVSTNTLVPTNNSASNSIFVNISDTPNKTSVDSFPPQMNKTINNNYTMPASDFNKSLSSNSKLPQSDSTNLISSTLIENKPSNSVSSSAGLQLDSTSKQQSSGLNNSSAFLPATQGLFASKTTSTNSNSTINNPVLSTKVNLPNTVGPTLNISANSASTSKASSSQLTSTLGTTTGPITGSSKIITNQPLDTSASLEKTHKALIESIHHERVDNLLINWEKRAKQRVQTFAQYADLVSEIDLNTILQTQKLTDLMKNQEVTFSRQKNLAQIIYNIEQQQKNLIPILNSVESELKSKISTTQDQNLDSNILLNSQQLQWLEQEISQINDIFINLSETHQPDILFSINKAIAMHESSIETLIQQVETLDSNLDKIENKIFK